MLYRKALATIKKYDMIAPGEHVLVGVSGGADSMALLRVLLEMKAALDIRLTVAHLDHMLRGEDSLREAEFTAFQAQKLGVPCIVERRDVQSFRCRQNLSLQEAARRVRYDFYDDAARRTGATKIALGHHADDQAETVLLWLLRGAALGGLAGIPPVRENRFIRPLLQCSRRRIEQYLEDIRQEFVPDSSAGELHYRRNKIRHELLPLLREQYNPNIVETLARTAELVQQDDEALEHVVRQALQECVQDGEGGTVLSLDGLGRFSTALQGRIMREAVFRVKGDTRGLTMQHIDALCSLLAGGGSSRTIQLPGGLEARREYRNVLIRRSPAKSVCSAFSYTIEDVPGSIVIPETGGRLSMRVESIEDAAPHIRSSGEKTAFFDLGRLQFPLTVRSRQPGDAFQPLGQPGTKKIQDFFTDCKVPQRLRDRVPLLVSGEDIAWVVGYRMDERFKVGAGAKTVLRAELTDEK